MSAIPSGLAMIEKKQPEIKKLPVSKTVLGTLRKLKIETDRLNEKTQNIINTLFDNSEFEGKNLVIKSIVEDGIQFQVLEE